MPVLVFCIFYGFCGDSTNITGHHIEFFVCFCFEDFLIPVKSSTLGIDFGQQLPLSFSPTLCFCMFVWTVSMQTESKQDHLWKKGLLFALPL